MELWPRIKHGFPEQEFNAKTGPSWTCHQAQRRKRSTDCRREFATDRTSASHKHRFHMVELHPCGGIRSSLNFLFRRLVPIIQDL